MQTYLAIITTALVLTQIIRVMQNTIQLEQNRNVQQKYRDMIEKMEKKLEEI